MRNRMKKWLPMLFMFLLLFILAVPVQAEGMKINKEELSILKGKSYTLKVTGTTKKPTWISVDPSIATVSPSGKVTAKRCGWTIIIADCYSEAEFCDVYVTEKPKVNSHVSYYATIPALDVTLKNRENDVKYGASCTKFLYCYYAYCVKDWGSKNLTYTDESGARVTNTLKDAVILQLPAVQTVRPEPFLITYVQIKADGRSIRNG